MGALVRLRHYDHRRRRPPGVAVTPDGSKVYVTNFVSNKPAAGGHGFGREPPNMPEM
jgi:hypothetical protein